MSALKTPKNSKAPSGNAAPSAAPFEIGQDYFMECPVCSHEYDTNQHVPHAFPCIHNVCSACLDALISKAKDEKLSCPVCRKATSSKILLPVNYGLRDVIAARFSEKNNSSGVPCDECVNPTDAIKYCSECLLWLCASHVNSHRNAKSTLNHELLSAQEKAKRQSAAPLGKTKCPVHADQVVTLFCETHSIAICDRCGMLKHKPCTLCDVTDVEFLQKEKDDLQKLVAEAQAQVQQMKALSSATKACQVKDKQAIVAFCDKLIASVTAQKQALLQAEEKLLADATGQAELLVTSTSATLAETQQLLQSNQLLRLLAMKPQLKQALQPDIASCKRVFADAFRATSAPTLQVQGSDEQMLAAFRERRSQLMSAYSVSNFLSDSVILEKQVELASTLLKFLPNPNCDTKLLWRATRDGRDAASFHSRCDNQGPTITLIQVGNYICGGYAACSWTSNGSYASPGAQLPQEQRSFLFHLVCPSGASPNKYAPANANEIYCGSGYGPTFGGGHDLYISNGYDANCYTNFGHSYQNTTGQDGTTFFFGSRNFTPTEVEVFQVV